MMITYHVFRRERGVKYAEFMEEPGRSHASSADACVARDEMLRKDPKLEACIVERRHRSPIETVIYGATEMLAQDLVDRDDLRPHIVVGDPPPAGDGGLSEPVPPVVGDDVPF